jgi:hypothetical protein
MLTRQCFDCKELYMRSCGICNNEYCLIDEDRATAFAVSLSICGVCSDLSV